MQNMFSHDVNHLSFRYQTFKFSCPTVKFYFSTLLKGKMILINKKGRNYQCTTFNDLWNQVKERGKDYSFSEFGRRLGCSFKNR